ncbi:MAG: hypothetical protein U1C47_14590 [Hydrogenophaga sp.]|nr:hypothetical protein [Hydrogenophaga sp.]
MRYELELIHQLSSELELPCNVADERAEVTLGQGVVLCFQNSERQEDCLIGFKGTPWHTHDDITFEDGLGNSIELNCLDLVSSLKDGSVFVCERWKDGEAKDRWLIHRDCNDLKNELKYMSEYEELRVFRARRTEA